MNCSELMSSCGAALKVNGSAIGPDQSTYHQVRLSIDLVVVN